MFIIPIKSRQHYKEHIDIMIDTINVELPKLEIKDTTFITGFDSLILKDKINLEKKRNYIYAFVAEKDSTCYYKISVALVPRSVFGATNVLGFFKIKNNIFIIRGEKLPDFLLLTEDKESFYYTTEWIEVRNKRIRWDTIKPEEFSEWDFCYKDKTLELLRSIIF